MAAALALTPRGASFIANKSPHRPGEEWWPARRVQPVHIDTALSGSAADAVLLTANASGRVMPSEYTVFKGEAWTVLSREFTDYVLQGADGFARHVLLFMANVRSAPEHYFQTVACNSPQFNLTVINEHLRFIDWGNGGLQHPRPVTTASLPLLLEGHYNSGALFARKFKEEEAKDLVDYWLLGRPRPLRRAPTSTTSEFTLSSTQSMALQMVAEAERRSHDNSRGRDLTASAAGSGSHASETEPRSAVWPPPPLTLRDGTVLRVPAEAQRVAREALEARVRRAVSTPQIFLPGCDWDAKASFVGKG